MKIWARRIGVALLFLVTVVLGVVLVRALSWSSTQLKVEAITPLAIDDSAIERLAGAVRIPTVSVTEGPDADFSSFVRFREFLERTFPQVHRRLTHELIGGHSLLFTWPGLDWRAQPFLLMAHMDVVPVEPGTEATWTHPPFSGELADGYIWGRGTLDDKSGVIAVLEAVELLLKHGFQPRQTVFLAFGHDEEIGGQAGAGRIAEVLKARSIRLEYALDEGLAVTRGMVPGLEVPAALVGIAEKGFASVELAAEATGGHSSMPPPSTAIGTVAAAVHSLEDHPMPASLDGPAALLFDRLGPEMPLLTKTAIANRWLFGRLIIGKLTNGEATNALVRTTTAATIIEGGVKENVLPARARAVVNFRIKPGDSIDSVLAHVKRTIANPRLSIRLLDPAAARNASPVSSTSSEGFITIERTIRQVFPGTLVAPSLVLGATDARNYEGIADNVYRFLPYVIGPDDMSRIHGTDERISIESYRNCVRFYAQLLTNEGTPVER
jgi:carboxypeptidase PM20D1